MDLLHLGWGRDFEADFEPFQKEGLIAARIGREDRQKYLLITATGELTGKVSGHFMNRGYSKQDYPAVGDWVAAEPSPTEDKATIQAVLPRRSCIARTPPGRRSEAQVVAANVDTVFIVNGLDGGRAFNQRRIERYLTLVRESRATPVLVLNKADVCDDVQSFLDQAKAAAGNVATHAVSAIEGRGVDALRTYITTGQTLAVLGSSGVGKSTLVNALLGTHRQAISEVRSDDRQGRHTTVRRELIIMPDGGILIDTPGMRELQMWGHSESVNETFADVDALQQNCRFNNCRHEGEPDCAIREAIDTGVLDPTRYESYLKLQREMAHHASRQNQKARLEEKASGKQLSKHIRKVVRRKHR